MVPIALTVNGRALRALVEPFLRTWQLDPTDPGWEQRRTGWIANLLDGTATVPGLLKSVTAGLLAIAPAFDAPAALFDFAAAFAAFFAVLFFVAIGKEVGGQRSVFARSRRRTVEAGQCFY